MHHCHRGVIYEPDPDGPIPQPCPNCYCPRCDRRWADCNCPKRDDMYHDHPEQDDQGPLTAEDEAEMADRLSAEDLADLRLLMTHTDPIAAIQAQQGIYGIDREMVI